MQQIARLVSLLSANLGAGALFGFYYTMNVSIMPGLDRTKDFVAIAANQDIGRATKESGFILPLLGTPVCALVAMGLHWKIPTVRNWLAVGMAGWVGMLAVTLTLNVPLNEILDGLDIEPNQTDLKKKWLAYSVDWQRYNWLRVITSGISLVGMAMAMRAPPCVAAGVRAASKKKM